MAQYKEIYKKIFFKLLEEILFILIALFIVMGIYIPIKNVLNKINKDQETIRLQIPKEESKKTNLEVEEDEVIIKKNQDGKYDIEIKNSHN